MIDLTPLEVRQKKGDFRRAMRGYDADLVDDFLDLVADRMEELVKENMSLGDRVEQLEAELSRFRTKEKSLTEALVSSQEMREDALKQAEKKAEIVLEEAELQAARREAQAARALAREVTELRRLKARRAQLVRSFRQFLERELAELDIIEETLELDEVPEEDLESWATEATEAVRSVAAEVDAAGDRAGPAEAVGPGAAARDRAAGDGSLADADMVAQLAAEADAEEQAEPHGPGNVPERDPAPAVDRAATPPPEGEAEQEDGADHEQTDWLSSVTEDRD